MLVFRGFVAPKTVALPSLVNHLPSSGKAAGSKAITLISKGVMSDETKLLVVLGATGLQGGAALRHFLSHRRKVRLRGIERDPPKSKAAELASLVVEVVKADLKDQPSLHAAFEGATHIFANIDSVELIFEGMQWPDLLRPDQSPFERGAEQEKLLARNLIDAARACRTLERSCGVRCRV